MSLDVKILNVNVGKDEVCIKLTRDGLSKDNTVQIDGRNYSIEYENDKTIPLVKQAVHEILDQNLSSIEEFQSKLNERININYSSSTTNKLTTQIKILNPLAIKEPRELSHTLNKEVVSAYLKKLEQCPYFSGVVKVQFSDGTSFSAVAKGSLTGQQFDENTLFNVMSVGKLFTAIGVMQLIEKGKIKLDGPINRYLNREQLELKAADPKYIEDMHFKNAGLKETFFNEMESSSITVRQLLTHTAGIVEWNKEGYCLDSNQQGKYNYSNYGYQLLARIIESQSENTFVDYVKNNIFTDPSDHENIIMPGALVHAEQPPLQEPVPTYVYKQNLRPVDEPVSVPKPDGNGCWWMNAGDLLNFNKNFMDGKYLSQLTKETMLTPALSRTPDGFLQQGLGFVLSPGKNNEPAAFANQGSFGGRSALISTIYDENTHISIAALCNCDSGSNFFADLIRMARGENVSAPLNYLKEEGEVTEAAIDWLSSQDTQDVKLIGNYLESHQVPYHLLQVIAKELEPFKPDIANILRRI